MNLAINGGSKIRTELFPEWPQFDEREKQALIDVLESRKWFAGYLGGDENSKVAEFEREFAKYQGADHAIAVTNGGAALAIALRALGIGINDEVIVPVYTYIATASAVLHNNALPVVVDIEPEHLCLDPTKTRESITERTKTIIPVHYGGQIANMDQINEMASDNNIYVVEDAAHAHGTTWKNEKAGQLGDIACFSFQESKIMTAGEGGILLTDNENLAERAKSFRSDGRKEGRPGYEHHRLGWNFRMPEFQAAVLLVQLERFKEQIEAKTQKANYLSEKLSDCPHFNSITDPAGTTLNGHYTYDVRFNRGDNTEISIDTVMEAIKAEGIPCDQMYLPINQSPLLSKPETWKENGMSFYTEYYPDDFQFKLNETPNANQAIKEIITFPHRILLGSKKDVEDVARALYKISRNLDELSK